MLLAQNPLVTRLLKGMGAFALPTYPFFKSAGIKNHAL